MTSTYVSALRSRSMHRVPWRHCPAAWTMSGLTSISVISGRARIRAPECAMTAAATALISTGGAAAEAVQQLRGLKLANLGCDFFFAQDRAASAGRRRAPPPTYRRGRASRPDPSCRIAPRADYEFDARAVTWSPPARHRAFSPGCARSTLACNCRPGLTHRLRARQRRRMTPPASVLCVRLGGLRLHRHRITDAVCDADRLLARCALVHRPAPADRARPAPFCPAIRAAGLRPSSGIETAR